MKRFAVLVALVLVLSLVSSTAYAVEACRSCGSSEVWEYCVSSILYENEGDNCLMTYFVEQECQTCKTRSPKLERSERIPHEFSNGVCKYCEATEGGGVQSPKPNTSDTQEEVKEWLEQALEFIQDKWSELATQYNLSWRKLLAAALLIAAAIYWWRKR